MYSLVIFVGDIKVTDLGHIYRYISPLIPRYISNVNLKSYYN